MRTVLPFWLLACIFLCMSSLYAAPIAWHIGAGVREEDNGVTLVHDLVLTPGSGQVGQRGAKGAMLLWDTLRVPGRYRVTVRARTAKLGLGNATLQAWTEQDTMHPFASMPLGGQVFAAAGVWQNFTLDFTVETGAVVTVGVMYLGDKTPPVCGALALEKATLLLERQDMPVCISRARSVKLRYTHADTEALTFRLTNTTDVPQTVTVLPMATVMEDNAVVASAASPPITVPARQTIDGNVPFRVAAEGGYALAVDVWQDNKIIDRGEADLFCVADNPFLFAIQPGGGLPLCGPGAHHLGLQGYQKDVLDKWDDYKKTAAQVVEGMRQSYVTYYEFFAWAREDATLLYEETDTPYLSGQTSYPGSRKQFQLLSSLLRAQGIAPVAYMNAVPFGFPGFEVMRKHPEWFNGAHSSFDIEFLEKYRQGIQPPYVYPCIPVNWDAQSPVDGKTFLDYHLAQLTASAKQYGWEAFRYDAGPLPVDKFRVVKNNLQLLTPRVYIGNNQGICCLGAVQNDRWTAYCRDESLMMEEIINEAFSRENDSRRKWVNWIDYLRLGSHLTRSNGGHYSWINHSGNYYSCALGYCVGGHPWTFQKNPYGDAERFMIRYGYYFWDLRTKMLPQPEAVLAVTAARQPWWKPLVSERVLFPNQQRQVIVPLINPPAEETVNGTTMVGRMDDVRLTFTPKPGETVTAWLLATEPTAHREKLPMTTLPDGKMSVRVPPFWVWTNVLFDCQTR